jgi:hypothetical protein
MLRKMGDAAVLGIFSLAYSLAVILLKQRKGVSARH